MGVGGQLHASTAFILGKDTVPIVQEVVWAPGPVWTDAENLAPTGIRFPDRSASSDLAVRTTLFRPHWRVYTVVVMVKYLTL